MLKSKQNNPEKLSKLFIQITDDLSYSRTFYPNRSVRVYLNNLAQQVFYNIYKSKKSKKGRLFSFWTEELPQLMYEARRELLLSFIVFTLAVIIGAFSCAMNPEFPRVILGDDYVDMTIRNIGNGDPMAVYKQMNEVDMSFGITWNNLNVGFRTFISGLFAGIGTIGILLYNGVMVGAFQFFFYEQGELRESFLTIWIHGTIEISTIILAGCAGLTLGKGLVFPGTYSRLQSLQKYGLRALKIMVGIVPLIITAGFIEGFVTRYTDAPDILRLGIILASLAFILLYFVWFPYQKNKEGFQDKIKDIKIPPSKEEVVVFGQVKTVPIIFMETFRLYAKHFSKIFQTSFALSIAYTLILAMKYGNDIGYTIIYRKDSDFISFFFSEHFTNIGQFFNYDRIPILGLVNTLVFGTIVYVSSFTMIRVISKTERFARSFHLVGWLISVGIWGLFNAVLLNASIGVSVLFTIFVVPFLLMWLVVILQEKKNPFDGLSRMFSLASGGFGSIYGSFFIMVLISCMFSYLISSPVLWFMIEVVGWNFSLEASGMAAVLSSILILVFSLFFCLIIPVFMISTALLYTSLKEIKDADALKERIKNIGVRKQAYGLEQEG
ncbi:MAG: stage II sporulation protein M [Saprospiraceae bacterium]